MIHLSILLALLSHINTISIPGTTSFTPPNVIMTHTYSYSGGPGINVIRYQLTYPSASDVGQILLWADSSASSDDTKLSSYQHFDPIDSGIVDLEDTNVGKKQVVEVFVGPSSSMRTINVINLNQYTPTSYSLSATELPTYSTSYCPSGNPLKPSSIFCASCNNNNVGAFCSINNQRVQASTTYTLTLYGWSDSRQSFGTFTIPSSSNRIVLYFKSQDVNIFNFLQFKEKSDQIAGLINYASSGGYNELARANSQYSITIITSDKDVSVSFLNYNNFQVSINIWYQLDSSSNILLIVLAVMGAIIFIGLIIVAICIVRKMNAEERVHPTRPLRVNIKAQSDLSAQEIQSYFPTVLARDVFEQQEEVSLNNLNPQNKTNEPEDRDCVICLESIVVGNMIKVLYCGHMFHDHCLVEWFKKNRNCPYCREQFNKKSTVEHYQNLLRIGNKTMLGGAELVSSIINNRKMMKSSLLAQEIKI